MQLKKKIVRRQDVPNILISMLQYIFGSKNILTSKKLINNNTIFLNAYLRSIDIDDKSILSLFEHIFKKFKQMKYKKISNSIIKSVNIFTKEKNIPLPQPSINERISIL